MAYSEKLGTNRGFELGDASQFTISGAGTNGVYTTSVGEGSYAWNLYANLNQTGSGDESEEILTDPVAAMPGQTYLVGMWAAMLANYRSGSAGNRSLEGRVNYYNSGGTIISYAQIYYAGTLDAFPATFTWYELEVTTPDLTASIRLWAKVRVWKNTTDPAQEVYRMLGVDGFSIKKKVSRGAGGVYLSDYGIV